MSQKFPHIAQSVSAHQSVTISGDVYIGENCELGKGVNITSRNGRLLIGEGVKVGADSKIHAITTRTAISDNVTIGANCLIQGNIGNATIIGDNVILRSTANVGNNCKIEANQELTDIDLPDNSYVKDGKIIHS